MGHACRNPLNHAIGATGDYRVDRTKTYQTSMAKVTMALTKMQARASLLMKAHLGL
jgi:hypothetical protein